MTDRVRVFQLIKSLGRGGAETLLPETLRHADRDRFDYRYGYFLPWKDAVVPDLEEQGVDVLCIPAEHHLSILFAARRVARILSDWNADVLHCHLPLAGIVGRIAGRLASVPVVYTEHNLLKRYHPVTRGANLLTWGWQKEVIAVSGEVAACLRQVAPKRIPVRVILNGVDVDRFDRQRVDGSEVRRLLGIPFGAPVVGTVAVFRIQKSLTDWLEAGRLILQRYPEARLLLVGDGPLRSELEAKATELGIERSIHWVGLQQDVRPYVAAMNIYMMSSVFEGLPIALLEAMSMRCAVISTEVGGIPEVIDSGSNGLLVGVGRPDQLALEAIRLLESPRMQNQLGYAARSTVAERFSVERMTRELEHTYECVVTGSGNAR